MALTEDFRETIRERAQQEPGFCRALLRGAIELMPSGDEKAGRSRLAIRRCRTRSGSLRIRKHRR